MGFIIGSLDLIFIIGSMDLQYSNTHRIEDKCVQNLILMLIPSSGHKIIR